MLAYPQHVLPLDSPIPCDRLKPVSLNGARVRLDLTILIPHLGFLAEGAVLTAEVCLLALVGSVILGMMVAIARTSSKQPSTWSLIST